MMDDGLNNREKGYKTEILTKAWPRTQPMLTKAMFLKASPSRGRAPKTS
jgi:hypothetical protein